MFKWLDIVIDPQKGFLPGAELSKERGSLNGRVEHSKVERSACHGVQAAQDEPHCKEATRLAAQPTAAYNGWKIEVAVLPAWVQRQMGASSRT